MAQMTLKAARINKDFTQREVAEKIGITRKTLSSWEKGTCIPRIDRLEALCALYDVKYDDIIFLHKNNA